MDLLEITFNHDEITGPGEGVDAYVVTLRGRQYQVHAEVAHWISDIWQSYYCILTRIRTTTTIQMPIDLQPKVRRLEDGD